jgi:hypothetical protein
MKKLLSILLVSLLGLGFVNETKSNNIKQNLPKAKNYITQTNIDYKLLNSN